eukprot:gene6922-66240_t
MDGAWGSSKGPSHSPRSALRSASRCSAGAAGPRCPTCQRQRMRRSYEAPESDWRPPHCTFCARRHLHRDSEGFLHCPAPRGCGACLCDGCAEHAAEDDGSSAEAPEAAAPWAHLAAPLAAVAAAVVSRAVRSSQLTRAELSVAAATRDRLRLYATVAEGRHRLRAAESEAAADQL